MSDFSISIKLTIALLICAIFTPLALVVYTVSTEEKTVQERKIADLQRSLEDKRKFITSILDVAAMDVRFLGQVPTLRIFSSISFDKPNTPKTQKFLDQFARINTTEVLVNFLHAKPDYQRISFLDLQGREQLRIVQEQGKIHVYEQKELPDNTENGGFKIDKIKQGDVFIVGIDLDYGSASAQQTSNPVIHLATIIYDKQDVARGILFFNYSGQKILEILKKGTGTTMLIDKQGDILAYHEGQNDLKTHLDDDTATRPLYPWLDPLSKRVDVAGNSHFQEQGKHIFISSIDGKYIKESRWFLVEVVPTALLSGMNRSYLTTVLEIAGAGILLSLLFGYILSKYWLLNPIQNLASMAGKMRRGEFPDVPAGKLSKDELGQLYTSFNRMSQALAPVEQEKTGHARGLYQELSRRKQNGEELILHRTFVEQSSASLLMADDQTKTMDINNVFNDMTRFSEKNALTKQPLIRGPEKNVAELYRDRQKNLDNNEVLPDRMQSRKSENESFHSQMEEVVDKRLQFETDLRLALKNDELELYYQPQVNQKGELLGYEALFRWIHPERGLILPEEFISVAEENGLIFDLGERVLLDACTQLVTWQKAGHHVPRMSINISPGQFSHPDFIAQVQHIIEETGVAPEHLVFEMTENQIIRNVENIFSNMVALKQDGILICIDDFGMSHCSQKDLKKLFIDELKIDSSLVSDLKSNPEHTEIIGKIAELAKNLNLELAADGVETKAQMDFLVRCGCKHFQGHYFSGLKFWLPTNTLENQASGEEHQIL